MFIRAAGVWTQGSASELRGQMFCSRAVDGGVSRGRVSARSSAGWPLGCGWSGWRAGTLDDEQRDVVVELPAGVDEQVSVDMAQQGVGAGHGERGDPLGERVEGTGG